MLRQRQASQMFTSTLLLTSREEKLGSSQEIKLQGPEEAKRRFKKKFIQVDRIKKIAKDVNSKSR